MANLKNLFLSVLTIAFVSVFFISCGDSDNETTGDEITEQGVYKVEVSFSGNVEALSPSVVFVAAKEGGELVSIFKDSGEKQMGEMIVSYDDKPFTQTTAYTSSDCRVFLTNILLINQDMKDCVLTVKCKGYFNGKLVKTGEKTVTFKGNDSGNPLDGGDVSATLNFSFEDGLSLMK